MARWWGTDVGGVRVLESPVLVHLPLGLGPAWRTAAIEHHGLLGPDGPAVGRIDPPRGACRLPVPRRRGPARPAAPRLALLPPAEVKPRLPTGARAAVNFCIQLMALLLASELMKCSAIRTIGPN
jgi:hypothetical protein